MSRARTLHHPGAKPRRLPAIELTCALVLLGAFGLASAACVNADDRVNLVAPSDAQADFKPVADFVIHRCGSLDCHGQVGRNLRLYGNEGLRLEPTGAGAATLIPGGRKTQQPEYDADYRSLVALEPEIMSQVVAEGGAQPERLTLIRKPRGLEQHTGGMLFTAGDPQDTCLTSWLSGTTDTAACATALMAP